MARLNKTRDQYDVPSDNPSEDELEEESEAEQQTETAYKASPSKQLLKESTAAQPPFSSPAKSVRFSDDLEESSALLAKAKSTKHNPSPLERNVPLVSIVNKQKEREAEPRGKRGRPSRADGNGAVSKPAIATAKSKRTAQMHTKTNKSAAPEKADGGVRRSGRDRTKIGNHNNLTNTLAEGVQSPAADKSADPSTPRSARTTRTSTDSSHGTPSSSSSHQLWDSSEDNLLRDLRETGKSWDEITKAIPSRSLVALQARASKNGYKPKSPGEEVSSRSTVGKSKQAPKRKAQSDVVSPRAKRQQTRHTQPNAEPQHSRNKTPETTPRRTKATNIAAKSKQTKSPNVLTKGVSKGIFNDPKESNAEEDDPDHEEVDEEELEETEQESSMVPFANNGEDRVYGQRPRLEAMKASIEEYMSHVQEEFPENYRIHKQLDSIQQSDQMRQEIRSKYSAMVAGEAEDMDALKDDIHDSLTKMIELARSVRPDEEKSVKRAQKLAKQFYAFLVVDLVKVLLRGAHCYNDLAAAQNEALDIPELNQLIRLSSCIVDICENARGWKSKVDSSLALVRPIQNNIIAPLKKVLDAFQRAKLSIRNERNELEASQRRLELARQEREREEAQIEEVRRETEIKRRFRFLYTERRAQYGGGARKFFEPKKTFARGHGRSPTYPFSLDSNGHPIERVDIFEARRTSANQIPSEADAPVNANVNVKNWPIDQLMAMEEALKTFYGLPGTDVANQPDYFWQRVFKTYCRRGGAFADLTVHDMLRMARDFQYANLEPDLGMEAADEEWIVYIPDLELLRYLPEE